MGKHNYYLVEVEAAGEVCKMAQLIDAQGKGKLAILLYVSMCMS